MDREKVIKELECNIPSRNEEERKMERLNRHLIARIVLIQVAIMGVFGN